MTFFKSALIALMLPGAVFAQQTTGTLSQPDAPAAAKPEVERLEVTGSYIRRIDIEGPSPLEMIDREEFLNSGSITLADVLKQNPSFEAVYEGVGHVRFRGQHAGNVLILLNGLRLPKLNGGYYTSVNGLPTSVLERVEMLKDGGSALYGSDAMSGVMNFKTRKDLQGGEVSINSTLAESGVGPQTSYVASFGRSNSRGNIMGVIQVEQAEAFSEADLGSTNRSPFASPVNTTTASFGSGSNRERRGPICANGEICSTDPLVFQQVRPEKQDLTGLVTGTYRFTEVDVTLLGMFNRREGTALRRPNRLSWTDDSKFGGSNNSVSLSSMSDSPLRQRIVDQGLADSNGNVSLSGTFVDQFGNTVTESKDESYNFQSEVKGYMGMSWTWQVQGGYAILNSENQVVSGEVDQNLLKELFREGRFDPSATGAAANAQVSNARLQPTYRNDGEMITTKAVLSGELFNLGTLYSRGGPVAMAVGTEAQWENFEFKNDQSLLDGTTLASRRTNYEGARNVQSAFMEISAYPIETLEVQLAHRFDHYSDVGNTYNPKLALAYTPHRTVMMRSSVGTGFRAPGITDLYAGTDEGSQRFTDQANCPNPPNCSSKFYDVTTFTDEDIKPESSLHYSFGAVIQPTKAVSLTLDQWNFEGEDTLSAVRAEEFTRVENEYGAGALESLGVTTFRDADGNLTRIEHPRVMNMGSRELRGLDVGLDVGLDLDFWGPMRLGFGSGHSTTFTRKTKKFDFDPEDVGAATWKNRIYTSLGSRNHYFRLSALTVSSEEIGTGLFAEKLPQYTEFDVSYSYNTSWGGKLNLAVRNISNTRPPVSNNGDILAFGSTDRQFSSFSPLRRRLFVGYSQTF